MIQQAGDLQNMIRWIPAAIRHSSPSTGVLGTHFTYRSCLTSLNFWTTILNLRSYYLTLKTMPLYSILFLDNLRYNFIGSLIFVSLLLIACQQNSLDYNSFSFTSCLALIFLSLSFINPRVGGRQNRNESFSFTNQ